MRHTIEARFFTADEREMVSFCLIGRSKDAVNTMTVNRFKKEHAGLWREVVGDHEAWNGGAKGVDWAATLAVIEDGLKQEPDIKHVDANPKAPKRRARKAL